MKIKAIYRKNLKMPEGKVASQVAHVVKNLGITPIDCDIIVLCVSDKKFEELVAENPNSYVQVDKGLTCVEQGTRTAAAWVVEDFGVDEKIELLKNEVDKIGYKVIKKTEEDLLRETDTKCIRCIELLKSETPNKAIYLVGGGRLLKFSGNEQFPICQSCYDLVNMY